MNLTLVINPHEEDFFETNIGISYQDVTAPLITDNGLYIHTLTSTPLYKGLYQFDMNVKDSKPDALDKLRRWIDNHSYVPISFKIPDISEVQSLWLKRMIQLLVYKQHGLKVVGYKEEGNVLFPLIKVINYIPNTFITLTALLYLPVNIDIIALINLKPVIDLYYQPVSVKVAASDLIQLFNLDGFDIETWVDDIPCLLLTSTVNDRNKAILDEFAYDDLSPIVTQISDMLFTYFSIRFIDISAEFLEKYGFKIIKKVNDKIFLHHALLDKAWLIKNMDLDQPMIDLAGEWMLEKNVDVDQLRIAAEETYVYLSYPIDSLNIEVGDNMVVKGPLNHIDDLEILEDEIMNRYQGLNKITQLAPGPHS